MLKVFSFNGWCCKTAIQGKCIAIIATQTRYVMLWEINSNFMHAKLTFITMWVVVEVWVIVMVELAKTAKLTYMLYIGLLSKASKCTYSQFHVCFHNKHKLLPIWCLSEFSFQWSIQTTDSVSYWKRCNIELKFSDEPQAEIVLNWISFDGRFRSCISIKQTTSNDSC